MHVYESRSVREAVGAGTTRTILLLWPFPRMTPLQSRIHAVAVVERRLSSAAPRSRRSSPGLATPDPSWLDKVKVSPPLGHAREGRHEAPSI